MTETLSEHDLHALMGVIMDGRRDDPTEGLPWAVLDGLAGLVRCEWVSLTDADMAHGHMLVDQWAEGNRLMRVGDPDPPVPAVFWQYAHEFLPCSYPERTGDWVSAVRWSDIYSPARLRGAPMFAEFYRPEGQMNGMHVSFPTRPGNMIKITFWRGRGPDFTERDRLVLELLRPHLWEVYLDAQRRRRSVPQLTTREWEVLQLAHQGRDNAEIAQELFISVATVRKHMEHIFDRTGARTRTAAAALMMPHHSTATAQRTHLGLTRPASG
jgi:DNA-binding CsgD family transcriptional regulator